MGEIVADYIQLAMLIAIVAGVVWSIVDACRSN